MCCLRKSPFNRKNVRKLLKHPFVKAFEQSSILDVNDVSDLEFDYLDSYPSPTDGKAVYEPKQAKGYKNNLEVKERKRIFKKKDYGELNQSFKGQVIISDNHGVTLALMTGALGCWKPLICRSAGSKYK